MTKKIFYFGLDFMINHDKLQCLLHTVSPFPYFDTGLINISIFRKVSKNVNQPTYLSTGNCVLNSGSFEIPLE